MTGCRDKHTLTFDAELHRYTLDARPVPAVTTVCRYADAPALLELMKVIGPAEFERRRDLGADFGTAIHAAAAALARGIPLLPLSLGERFSATVEMLGNWFADEVVEVLHCEETMASSRRWVAGKPDLVAMLRKRSRPVIVDYKSGRDVYLGAVLQQAAYQSIVKEWHGLVCSRLIVHLPAPEEGKAPTLVLHPLRNQNSDMAAFDGALALWRRSQEASL